MFLRMLYFISQVTHYAIGLVMPCFLMDVKDVVSFESFTFPADTPLRYRGQVFVKHLHHPVKGKPARIRKYDTPGSIVLFLEFKKVVLPESKKVLTGAKDRITQGMAGV